MVADISELQQVKDIVRNRGLVIELVGVAGVGKTTLFRALCNKSRPKWIEEYAPPVWKLSAAPFYIKNIILIAPVLIRLLLNGSRPLKRRELAFMAILHGWHEVLRSNADNENQIIVLDQGLISIIGYLLIWGPQGLRNENMQGWWNEIFEKCSRTLDMVFLLDTADETIMRRIRTRPQDHFLKASSDDTTRQWTVRYRMFYDHIIARLNSYPHKIQVVNIDSGKNNIDDIVRIVLDEVNQRFPEIHE